MNNDLSVVVYTHDTSLFDLLRGLVGVQGTVFKAEEGSLPMGHLGCIIIDLAHHDRVILLDGVNDLPNGWVVAVVSANPFAVSLVRQYTRIDAFLTKPINGESVQAFLVGARAKVLSYVPQADQVPGNQYQ